jgi:hypothetical protein
MKKKGGIFFEGYWSAQRVLILRTGPFLSDMSFEQSTTVFMPYYQPTVRFFTKNSAVP